MTNAATDASSNGASKDSRCSPRYALQKPVLVVPVLPDGRPGQRPSGSVICRDLSREGIGLELDSPEVLPTPTFIVGIRGPNGDLLYEGVDVRHMHRAMSNRVAAGGRFGGIGHDILQLGTLLPALRRDSLTYAWPFPEEVLGGWVDLGILCADGIDRVQLCPRCHGLPTWRPGCRHCGSARVGNDKLIHHFACAHVGLIDDFEDKTGELVCPKCRTHSLVVGSDYEYVTGPYRCQDCHWSDMEIEQVAQCLCCGLRFPSYQAYVQELRGYRANRLDPLAFVPAA